MRYRPHRMYMIDNQQGWELELRCFREPSCHDPARRPVVMIPGYAMNTFILSYHPSSLSMVEFLARDGFEVWTANLRGQGGSRRVRGNERFGLQQLSLVDIPVVLDCIRRQTQSKGKEIDVIGCSLGASMLYGYLSHFPQEHGVGSMIAVGGPLRWERVHPAMRLAFASPGLAGRLPIRGSRRLARAVIPLAQRFPSLLAIYMNANMIDLSAADELVNTVDDPVPHINRQIAHWMKKKDLVLDGRNVTESLRGMKLPVMCILANADGIVPRETALSIRDVLGHSQVTTLEVGDDVDWFAHADLFVSDMAQERVFAPMRDWLLGQQRTNGEAASIH